QPRWRATRVLLTEVPLTSFTGYQGEPAFSPDGNQFAFIWDGGQENGSTQLYVSLVGRGPPLRLTNTATADANYPSWSPDGQMIAFVRYPAGKETGDLVLIPALGGPARKIDEGVPRAATQTRGSNLMVPAWSPDGKWLYFTAITTAKSY